MSNGNTKILTEPDDWSLYYPEYADLSIDSAIAFYLGNSPLPPSKDAMLEQDPQWLHDVFLNVRLLRFQLDQTGD